MNIAALFRKKTTPSTHVERIQTDVLKLKKNQQCYYSHYKEPFTVVDAGVTPKGVNFVEIKHTASDRKFLFFDKCFVYVDNTPSFTS
ncbi:MAG: hypothetical protein NZ551_11415 [Microscillaceae bacterium]|nr:hypothetical protein [Microscillaceae bacterium]MDW8461803.1 hypothetical protein [Cytophagales bacterium]